jgi:hypothetical protein
MLVGAGYDQNVARLDLLIVGRMQHVTAAPPYG